MGDMPLSMTVRPSYHVHRQDLMLGDDCNINEAGPNSDKNFKMSDDSCIRQSGRQSFWPGDKGTEGGDYCFVYYKDGDCVCIEGARRIHTN